MNSFIHSNPQAIDYQAYKHNSASLESFYGLPPEVYFCSKCGNSNQRPNSTVEHRHTQKSQKSTVQFDSNNVCDACKVANQKHNLIDWQLRRKELEDLCDKYRRSDGSYDSLVPGSGGKDSFYQSWMLKYEFNMNPLTVTWAPHLYTEWGRRNFDR